ncbi:hypothetical protein D9M70_492950 [compost metagenome]
MADLETVAALELVGELSEAAQQIGAGAFDLLAVAGGEIVALAEVEVAEELKPFMHAIGGEPRGHRVAVEIIAGCNEATETVGIQQIARINRFIGDRTGERPRAGIGRGNAGIDVDGLQEARIDEVRAIVVEDLVVLAAAVHGHGKARFLDAMNVDLLRHRQGAADGDARLP